MYVLSPADALLCPVLRVPVIGCTRPFCPQEAFVAYYPGKTEEYIPPEEGNGPLGAVPNPRLFTVREQTNLARMKDVGLKT